MAKKESYESRVEAFLLPLMEENHFELVDVEYVKEPGICGRTLTRKAALP